MTDGTAIIAGYDVRTNIKDVSWGWLHARVDICLYGVAFVEGNNLILFYIRSNSVLDTVHRYVGMRGGVGLHTFMVSGSGSIP